MGDYEDKERFGKAEQISFVITTSHVSRKHLISLFIPLFELHRYVVYENTYI
jgi:hypothetical protein